MRVYDEEEKREYVQEFIDSGKSIYSFAKEKGIPQTTFKGWIRQYNDAMFGKIDLRETREANTTPIQRPIKNTTIFSCENIRIELKENYNKELLKKIMEVLINA